MENLAYPIIQKCLQTGKSTSQVAAIGYAASFENFNQREECLQFIMDWSTSHSQTKTAQEARKMLGNTQNNMAKNQPLFYF